jgi:hypothetical protein
MINSRAQSSRLATTLVGTFLSVLLLVPAGAFAHAGNPSFRSEVKQVRPSIPGLSVEVQNYDDRLVLVNATGKTVLVRGYDGEPYVRILGDKTVEVNKRSPSYYLNEDRFAQVKVPAEANERAAPAWDVVGKSGRYEWHDHRIHWMSKDTPPQVEDKSKPARIFDWRVPLVVGAQRASVTGTLSWEPEDSGVPTAALIALGGLAAVSLLLFALSRRLRTRKLEERRSDAW